MFKAARASRPDSLRTLGQMALGRVQAWPLLGAPPTANPTESGDEWQVGIDSGPEM